MYIEHFVPWISNKVIDVTTIMQTLKVWSYSFSAVEVSTLIVASVANIKNQFYALEFNGSFNGTIKVI